MLTLRWHGWEDVWLEEPPLPAPGEVQLRVLSCGAGVKEYCSGPLFARATLYFPFGGSSRQCSGRGMTLMEAKMVLATVTQRCRLRLASDRPVETRAVATLRPHNLVMTVQPA